MRVYYKEQLVNEINQSFLELIDLPKINGVVVKGDLTLNMLDVYTKEEINELLKAINKVYVSETEPTNPQPNSTYYIGTSAPYSMHLYLDDGSYIDMGIAGTNTYNTILPVRVGPNQSLYLNIDKDTIKYDADGRLITDFEYNAGVGLEKVNDTFNLLVDDVTLSINDEKQVTANVFEPATSATPGKKGLVIPWLHDEYNPDWLEEGIRILGGDGQWHDPELTYDVGSIKIWPTPTIPNGWLACDGSSISRDVYADLFAVIGTTYGEGDGLTTFNLPDMRNRLVVGNDGTTNGNTLSPSLPFEKSVLTFAGVYTGGITNLYALPGASSSIGTQAYTPNNSKGWGATLNGSKNLCFDPGRSNAVYSDSSSDSITCLEPANLKLMYIIKS